MCKANLFSKTNINLTVPKNTERFLGLKGFFLRENKQKSFFEMKISPKNRTVPKNQTRIFDPKGRLKKEEN